MLLVVGRVGGVSEVKLIGLIVVLVEEDNSFGSEIVDSYYLGGLNE